MNNVSEHEQCYQDDDRILTEWADTTYFGVTYWVFEKDVDWTIDYVEVYGGLQEVKSV